MRKKLSWLTLSLVLINIVTLIFLSIISLHYKVPQKVLVKLRAINSEPTKIEYKPEPFQLPAFVFQNVSRENFSVYNKRKYAIVMLGDSITARVAWNELLGLPGISNRAIEGDYTLGVLHRLEDIYELNPKLCFLMIGTNDIPLINNNYYTVETIVNNIKEIIKELQNHNIDVCIESILYTAFNSSYWKDFNGYVKTINYLLEEYCEKNNILYLDVNELLSKDDRLEWKYTSDGVHLFGDAYKKWGGMILEVLKNK
ncbi:lipolytic enzyme, GDSL domain protein [Treponema primitia ZAS-2]|uniref:Lipolytic enzyme, GDSL domain protein n=1 Tax=Treponema primitia (strain ATCC BAA-887 / DSM 12427 / ZAS-2) TaxID=545694 RepID=F5YKT3_TREPZ|nr:GDSL-type esterase/lipase family protein [Treponema primitia]AEF84887.1 lipolytic enzyme, GDSL domain protein [Treponema primitia ZAS-2]